jgi:hypothetical protein
MTTLKQIDANRRNARKSTGPITEEGKQQSRCNAVRHGLTAETVIGALENAEDYRAFEEAIIADYEAESAVERELVLRLASLLWRLRRSMAIETGMFEIQADHLSAFRRARHVHPSRPKSVEPVVDHTVEVARCFLRLANLANYALDRLSRYEVTLWRQVGQILFALDSLDRRKPQERRRRTFIGNWQEPPTYGYDER